ncbi:Rv1733c family protein [Streptomyces sp. NPDC002758]
MARTRRTKKWNWPKAAKQPKPPRKTGYRFWRWRHNPLRRRCDVFEAWIVLATWTLALLGGLLAGAVAAGMVDQSLDARRAQVHPVTAVLTADAAPSAPASTGYDTGRSWATVRWTTANGAVHTGQAQVAPGAAAGTRVMVWTDNSDHIVTAPLTPTESLLQAGITAALVAPAAGVLVWAGGRLVRGRLIKRRLAEWDEEWKRVGPQWRNLSGGRG